MTREETFCIICKGPCVPFVERIIRQEILIYENKKKQKTGPFWFHDYLCLHHCDSLESLHGWYQLGQIPQEKWNEFHQSGEPFLRREVIAAERAQQNAEAQRAIALAGVPKVAIWREAMEKGQCIPGSFLKPLEVVGHKERSYLTQKAKKEMLVFCVCTICGTTKTVGVSNLVGKYLTGERKAKTCGARECSLEARRRLEEKQPQAQAS